LEPEKQNSVELTVVKEHQEDILTTLAEHTEQSLKIEGVVVGFIITIDKQNNPMVDFDCNVYKQPIPAISLVEINKTHTGCKVALMFEKNRADKPIIMGFMHIPEQTKSITAEKELLIKCGKASIRLKENGDIVINGRELISRARKNNIIRGGTILLN
jgi:hypothetical protein